MPPSQQTNVHSTKITKRTLDDRLWAHNTQCTTSSSDIGYWRRIQNGTQRGQMKLWAKQGMSECQWSHSRQHKQPQTEPPNSPQRKLQHTRTWIGVSQLQRTNVHRIQITERTLVELITGTQHAGFGQVMTWSLAKIKTMASKEHKRSWRRMATTETNTE